MTMNNDGTTAMWGRTQNSAAQADYSLPVNGIGFAAMNSAVNRNVHNMFHVDQHRRTDAASWDSA